ncbi:MAG: TIGR01459 family HAD-type hydrolase [Inquilinus sp.]|nr:TIGR01459 family HAD-type hydrolase [Inquilinus sp.]
MTTDIPILNGIAGIADRYDGYILDLWGVVHNGLKPLPGVIDTLERLRATGRHTCLLSNAPRRLSALIDRLEEIGVPRRLYDHVMSSGEATHEALAGRADPFTAELGRRCLHIGPPRDVSIYGGLGYEVTESPAEADFVLNTGIREHHETVADYEEVMAAAARRGLPMICANPDLVVMVGDTPAICAGALAARYEALGGAVVYYGKPYPSVYEACFGLLAGIDRGRILAVGDSFRTDIAGANAMGLDSLLVAGGIHADDLSAEPGGPIDPGKLGRAAEAAGHRPTYAAPGLIW